MPTARSSGRAWCAAAQRRADLGEQDRPPHRSAQDQLRDSDDPPLGSSGWEAVRACAASAARWYRNKPLPQATSASEYVLTTGDDIVGVQARMACVIAAR